MDTQSYAGVLGDLVEVLEDGHKGFDEAAERLDSSGRSDVGTTMRDFSGQRAEFAAELRDIAASSGIHLDEKGSATGALQRGWMGVKDAITDDADISPVLDVAEASEDRAVEEYEEALKVELPGDLRVVIERQAVEVRRAHDQVRDLRDSL